jgi:hypothetical protein
MRVAFAPVDLHWDSPENKIPPDVRADLVAWFDGWHGLTVAESKPIIELRPVPTKITPITYDTAPVRALCEQARAEHIDAIVFTTFVYGWSSNVTCTRWSYSKNGECAEYGSSSRSSPSADLTFRVLYPARCVFTRDHEVGVSNVRVRAWKDFHDVARQQLPDLLHELKGEYEVSEKLVYCTPDNAACAAPTARAE